MWGVEHRDDHTKGDIDRYRHDYDYAEHVIGGAHVDWIVKPERSTAHDRPKKSHLKTDR
jgi:hypothetical protein